MAHLQKQIRHCGRRLRSARTAWFIKTYAQDERGQMTVELAFLIPVVLVAALIAVNAGYYASLCARFDRAAADIAAAHGAAPSGEQSTTNVKAEVEDCLQRVMGDAVSVQVSIDTLDAEETEPLFTLNPTRVRIRCKMIYVPRPASFSISGVDMRTPFELAHETSLVIDMGSAGLGARI